MRAVAQRLCAVAALVALTGCVVLWHRGAAKGADVSGLWRISWSQGLTGELELTQSGARVDGKIVLGDGGEGQVRGTVDGGMLRFVATYKEGLMVNYSAMLSPDGKELLYGSTVSSRGAGTWCAAR